MFFEEQELEELAKALHNAWMQEKLAQGWKYGPVKDFEKKTHPDLIPYEDLPEDKKELDRMYIRDFLKILERAGFGVARCDTVSLSEEDIEKLAKASHELWLEKTKERSPEENAYFRPYEELPEEAKELNRRTVRELLGIFKSRGYGVVKV